MNPEPDRVVARTELSRLAGRDGEPRSGRSWGDRLLALIELSHGQTKPQICPRFPFSGQANPLVGGWCDVRLQGLA